MNKKIAIIGTVVVVLILIVFLFISLYAKSSAISSDQYQSNVQSASRTNVGAPTHDTSTASLQTDIQTLDLNSLDKE